MASTTTPPPARKPRLLITPELMQQAWQQQTRGPAWPATFDEAMASDFFRRLVRVRAVQLAEAELRRQRAPFDARRAAANDLE